MVRSPSTTFIIKSEVHPGHRMQAQPGRTDSGQQGNERTKPLTAKPWTHADVVNQIIQRPGVGAPRTDEQSHHGLASLHRREIEAEIMTLLINPRKGRINRKSKTITTESPRCVRVSMCSFTEEKRRVMIHVKRRYETSHRCGDVPMPSGLRDGDKVRNAECASDRFESCFQNLEIKSNDSTSRNDFSLIYI